NARLKVFWGADDGNVMGSRRFFARGGGVLAGHGVFAALLACAPRGEGAPGKIRLGPIARAAAAGAPARAGGGRGPGGRVGAAVAGVGRGGGAGRMGRRPGAGESRARPGPGAKSPAWGPGATMDAPRSHNNIETASRKREQHASLPLISPVFLAVGGDQVPL